MANESLQAILYADDEQDVYAIIDGASCKELLDKLAEFNPETICLFAGELEPSVAACAPYLVALPPEHGFTEWLLAEGFGKHWGIFVRSAAGIRALRKHFRTFLLVHDPEGKKLYFRYYDPRVLVTYLPTCNARELATMFGPVSAYVCESGRPPGIAVFHLEHGAVRRELVALPPPANAAV